MKSFPLSLTPGGGGTVNNAAVNEAIEEDVQATLRTARVIGYDAMAQPNRKLWRPLVKMMRKRGSERSFKTLVLGDSVAVDLANPMQEQFGYGGSYTQATFYNSVSGTATTVADFVNSPSGSYRRLSTAGHYMQYEPTGLLQAVGVQYIAKNAGGSFKLQYQAAKTGAWTDLTATWSVAPVVRRALLTSGHNCIAPLQYHMLEAGMTVTGTGIPGGTTVSSVAVSNVSKTAVTATGGSGSITLDSVTGLSVGMKIVSGPCKEGTISSINPGTNVITVSTMAAASASSVPIEFRGPVVVLSANCTSTTSSDLTFQFADGGANAAAGELSTNNSGAEKYTTSWILLPGGPNFYNLRLVHVAGGSVDIAGLIYDCGSFGRGTVNALAPEGTITINVSAAGTTMASHESTTQAVWDRFMSALDPEIIIYKTANALDLTLLETYWEDYAAKLRAAAPEALLVVVGSHASGADLDRDSAQFTAVDNYWRDWCSKNDGALFVDLRANMPDFTRDYWSVDGLMSDGIHPYQQGLDWAAELTMAYLSPALDAIGRLASSDYRTITRPFPGNFNEVRLYENQQASTERENMFTVAVRPDVDGFMGLRRGVSGIISNNFGGLTGIGVQDTASSGNTAGQMVMLSDGVRVNQWSALRGAYWSANGVPSDGTKANNGLRFQGPTSVWSVDNFSVEAQHGGSGNTTASTLKNAFGIDINSSPTAEGAALWEWMPDGTVKNHGVVWKGSAVCTLQSTTTVLVSDTSGLVTGMTVWGDGIPNGATISSISANVSITLSAAATLSGARPLAFTRSGTTTSSFEEYGTDATIHHTRGAVAGTGTRPRYNLALPGYADAAGAAADGNLPSGGLYYDESTGVGRIKP